MAATRSLPLLKSWYGSHDSPEPNRGQTRTLVGVGSPSNARSSVEKFFQRMKAFMRAATPFDQPDRMFLGFVHISAITQSIG